MALEDRGHSDLSSQKIHLGKKKKEERKGTKNCSSIVQKLFIDEKFR